jgi:hypothetical protein
MGVLGIILLLAAVALVVLLLTAGTSSEVVLDLVGGQQLTTSPAWIFLAGAVALALAEVGLMLMTRGTKRAVARRREIRQLRAAAAPSEHGDGARGNGADVAATQDDLPDRTLVRNVDELRAHDPVDRSTGQHRSPEDSADPEGDRHELRPDDVRQRRV